MKLDDDHQTNSIAYFVLSLSQKIHTNCLDRRATDWQVQVIPGATINFPFRGSNSKVTGEIRHKPVHAFRADRRLAAPISLLCK